MLPASSFVLVRLRKLFALHESERAPRLVPLRLHGFGRKVRAVQRMGPMLHHGLLAGHQVGEDSLRLRFKDSKMIYLHECSLMIQ